MPELVTADDLHARAAERITTLGLDGNEIMLLGGCVSTALRNAQYRLDRAKDDDAVNRWARLCVEYRALLDKLKEADHA